MIKEDNLSDTNKHYLTLHETSNLHSQGSGERKNGRKAGNFYKIKNKEKAEKNRKYMIGCDHIINLT